MLPKTKIVQKLFVGYLLMVLIPFLIFGYFVYNQAQSRFLEQYLRNRQELIEQASNSLQVDLTQVESVYQLFQYNEYMLEYLSGNYRSESQYVYNLLKNIRPLYSFVSVGNKQIQGIRMYSINPEVETLEPEFGETNELIHKPEYGEIQALPPGKGLWVMKQSTSQQYPSLIYYQKIYNSQFSKQIGIMEIKVSDDVINMLMEKIKTKKDDRVLIISPDSKLLFGDLDHTEEVQLVQKSASAIIQESKSGHYIVRGKRLLSNMVTVESLDVVVISYTNEKGVFENLKKELQFVALGGVICLFMLSAVYYWIVSSLTKRIVKLSRHMRRVGFDNLSMYTERTNDRDEIDYLTSSYNAMLQRIDDLVNKVHREELLRKEADYKVLQAQIKPHFLYNTLESIRMMAEVNEAPEVANFTHTFGKLIRYSLSNDKFETTLHDELEHVRNFLQIHKIRVGERLDYAIEVDARINRFVCPRFILQPLVENSIIHGLSRLRKQWMIRLRIYEENGYLKVEIKDNGVGIEADRLRMIQGVLHGELDLERLQTESGGLGVYNVHERIKSFYGNQSGLSLNSNDPNGMICIIQMYKGELESC
ncbi:histidine kinase [Paenibacillus sp. BIHB 4019]|nr:histidine kinase [Paenibacillus sp. BIHB 4019]